MSLTFPGNLITIYLESRNSWDGAPCLLNLQLVLCPVHQPFLFHYNYYYTFELLCELVFKYCQRPPPHKEQNPT